MRKKVALLVALVAALQCAPVFGYVTEVKAADVNSGIEVQSEDVIVTKFRNNNGVRQYRRWNATKARWVDPDWINVP